VWGTKTYVVLGRDAVKIRYDSQLSRVVAGLDSTFDPRRKSRCFGSRFLRFFVEAAE